MRLLALIGSRARGDAHAGSDWDFAGIFASPGGREETQARLTSELGTDAVDVVDPQSAGALIRFHAARDGVLLHESDPAACSRCRIAAITFWCDAGPTIERGYRNILARLGP